MSDQPKRRPTAAAALELAERALAIARDNMATIASQRETMTRLSDRIGPLVRATDELQGAIADALEVAANSARDLVQLRRRVDAAIGDAEATADQVRQLRGLLELHREATETHLRATEQRIDNVEAALHARIARLEAAQTADAKARS